jgi:prepilin-type processing-associated H-X9-DG protein
MVFEFYQSYPDSPFGSRATTYSGLVTYATAHDAANDPRAGTARHLDGGNYCFADGHVKGYQSYTTFNGSNAFHFSVRLRSLASAASSSHLYPVKRRHRHRPRLMVGDEGIHSCNASPEIDMPNLWS